MRSKRALLVIGIFLLSACAYMLDGRVRATEKPEKPRKVSKQEFNEDYYRFAEVLSEVFLQIRERYVEEVKPADLFEGALNGVFEALDRHSVYLNSDNFKDLEKTTEGEFSGIGIHIDNRDGVLTVISPIPGTPAARAGLIAWDRIVEIEGESTEGMTVSDAVKKLTGPVGTQVKILIYRERTRERLPFTIVRDQIKIQSVYSNVDETDYVTPYFTRLLDNKIGYIRLTRFQEHVSEEIGRILDKMAEKGVQGLILDVRYNSGGLLDEGIRVADLFLDKGQIVVATKGRLPEQNRVYRASGPRKVNWPMILMVNQGSASASEILAGALQDHQRAVVLGPEGQNTFGKASVQSIASLRVSLSRDGNGNDLPNAIKLTTARYYTPNNAGEEGVSIHNVGIKPDLTVKLTLESQLQLSTRGLLLGDPPLTKEEEKDRADSKKDGSDAEKEDESEEKVSDEESSKSNSGKSEPDANGDDEPFYLKNKTEKEPSTEDLQLKYGVDVLRALLIVAHAKA